MVFADSPFANPKSPFERPVPLVLVDPDVSPDRSICIRHEWLPYINGALQALVLQATWDTDDPTALQLVQDRAQLLIAMFIEAGACPVFMIRNNPSDTCLLDVSNDGGATWSIAEASIEPCASAISSQQIDARFPPGNPPANGQPGTNPNGPAPAPGACYDYKLSVTPDGPALIPLNIVPGDTITLIDATGAWSDGQLGRFLSVWQCPNSQVFLAGTCTGAIVPTTDVTDPLQTAGHMELILSAPDGTFHAIRTGVTYEVPSGMPAGNFQLVCNQGSAAFNLGSVQAHIQVCNAHDDETIAVTVDGTVSTIDFHTAIGRTYTITVFDTWWLGASSNVVDTFGDVVQSWVAYRAGGLVIGVQREPVGGTWEYLDPPTRRTDHSYQFTRAGDGNQWNFRWFLPVGGPSGGGPFHVRVQG